ncbi:tryptophan-rich sensory protein [Roseicyclus sp.]
MDWGLFAIFLAACGAAATTGSMFMPGAWYRGLSKPGWTPPDWVFPVAWTVLYLSSAIAAARIAPLEGNACSATLPVTGARHRW